MEWASNIMVPDKNTSSVSKPQALDDQLWHTIMVNNQPSRFVLFLDTLAPPCGK